MRSDTERTRKRPSDEADGPGPRVHGGQVSAQKAKRFDCSWCHIPARSARKYVAKPNGRLVPVS